MQEIEPKSVVTPLFKKLSLKIFGSTLTLFIVFFCYFYLTKEPPIPFFTSSYFSKHTENLQNFIQASKIAASEKSPSVKAWAENVSTFVPTTAKANQAFYQHGLKTLRHAINTNEAPYFTRQFVEWLYLINPFWDSFNESIDTQAILSLKTSLKTLDYAFKNHKFYDSSSLLKNPFEASISDMTLEGNLPFPLFTIKNGPHVIRTATPIMKSANNTYTVSPEFSLFLKTRSEQKKKHIYINLMKIRKEELPETELLHEQEALYPGLKVVTLDACSAFYWQKEPYQGLSNSKAFKETFLAHLFEIKQGYRWSNHTDLSTWAHTLKHLLNKIHSQFFLNKKKLSVKERQAFIQLAHLKIVYSLTKQDLCDSINISCQHTLDRGGSFLGLLYYIEKANKKGAISEKDLNSFIGLMVELPPLVHNRLAHEKRIKRTILALKSFYKPLKSSY